MAEGTERSLSAVDIFTDLPAKELLRLEQRVQWHQYENHQQIIDRESDSRDVFFIVKGKVRVVNYSLSGREVSFDDIEQGGYFGELAALDGAPRSASIVALAPTTVAIMSPTLFRELLLNYPHVALRLINRLVSVIRASTSRIMDLSTLGANIRVHAELLRLAKPVAGEDNTARIEPMPLHGDIASRISAARETVARELSDLARDGIVERVGNALIIRDVARLTELVEQSRGE